MIIQLDTEIIMMDGAIFVEGKVFSLSSLAFHIIAVLPTQNMLSMILLNNSLLIPVALLLLLSNCCSLVNADNMMLTLQGTKYVG